MASDMTDHALQPREREVVAVETAAIRDAGEADTAPAIRANARNESLTVVICSDFGAMIGGLAKVTIDSAIGLRERGHRPIFFAATGPMAPELQDAGVETICLDQYPLNENPSRLAGAIQGSWNTEAAARLGRLLAGLPQKSSVVHVHSWAKALSPSIAPAIAGSGLPAVFTSHDYFLFCPGGGFYNFQKSHACHLKPLSAACWATDCDMRSYGRKLWRNARLSFAKAWLHFPEVFSDFITISNFQRNVVAPFVPKEARLHLLSNPIAVPDLGPKADPISGDIIFVGRLSEEKGALLFAEAARKIGLAPIFVGDGPLAQTIAERYPEARLLGWQSSETVVQTMRGARALVFPALLYEGQPLVVLEAKALGIPIVVADTCAGRDEVEDGVTGLWFKGGDADDLARALSKLSDDALVTRMSAAAYASYWANPSTVERHVDGLVDIYRAMVA